MSNTAMPIEAAFMQLKQSDTLHKHEDILLITVTMHLPIFSPFASFFPKGTNWITAIPEACNIWILIVYESIDSEDLPGTGPLLVWDDSECISDSIRSNRKGPFVKTSPILSTDCSSRYWHFTSAWRHKGTRKPWLFTLCFTLCFTFKPFMNYCHAEQCLSRVLPVQWKHSLKCLLLPCSHPDQLA